MKQTPAHDSYNDTVRAMLPLNLRRVIEVGCMRGALARAYKQYNPACEWIGVDIDQTNVHMASTICDQAICRDIESLTDEDFDQWTNVDAWVFGDALEHLRDPWSLLSRIRRTLSKDGVVVASIPNAQHWSFQVAVNAGLFRYEDDGLFDRTHLRFFTRITIFEMFESTGYRIDQAVSRILNRPAALKFLPHIRAMAAENGLDPDVAAIDAMAYQYVVRATAR